MRFEKHILLWSSLLYFVASESLGLGAWGFYPLVVVLPWWWFVRSEMFSKEGKSSWLSLNLQLWVRFLSLFIKEFMVANFKIIKLIWSPRPLPETAWIDVETSAQSPLAHMMIANFISLTPGTISWDIQKNSSGAIISVHVLDARDCESIQPFVRRLEKIVRPMTEEHVTGESAA